MVSPKSKFLPAEWYPQSGVMLTWPHAKSDWIDLLDEVEACFIVLANEILKNEKLIVVTPDPAAVVLKIDQSLAKNLQLVELQSNDTWARDHGPITMMVNGIPELYDFQFNGWGLKFPAWLDNQITFQMFKSGLFSGNVRYMNCMNFVFEGGSFETDGLGTMLTTEACLLSKNRNQQMSKPEIESFLIKVFDLERILWLSSGYLAGDDTDSHIDTLVRFCHEKCIAYVKCSDPSDEHYLQLKQMEEEIRSFKTLDGRPYELIALPMADYVEDDAGNRLPATYANFLIINNKVLMPFYSTAKDEIARTGLQKAFPDREVVGVECSALIKQHGSLHCVTMQLPLGVI
ncbi:MAG: agmatine deiminase family protein [Prolixibacteraceae bacterium]|nr:agmatine deiminase family protein [Prolixibacteraceae bacterium]